MPETHGHSPELIQKHATERKERAQRSNLMAFLIILVFFIALDGH